ncbi:unnamed protein product, partial [marine sediment metagenome]
MEIMRSQNRDRELEETRRLAQEKEKKFEETKRELEVLKKGGGSPSNEKAPKALTAEDIIRLYGEQKKKENEMGEKSALMETLNLIKQGMDNLNTRISSVEQAGSLAKPVEKAKNPMQEQIDSAVGKRI